MFINFNSHVAFDHNIPISQIRNSCLKGIEFQDCRLMKMKTVVLKLKDHKVSFLGNNRG